MRMPIGGVLRDLRYASRSFLRAPLAALTIVMTIGVGLGLVAVVFTILNAFVFRVDAVRNPHELFAVERQRSVNADPQTFTRDQYETLIRETNVFSDTFASTGDVDAWIDGRRFEGPLVTGNFFRVLGVTAARGRTLTPADDAPGAPPVIVLSHRTWSLHFASDPGILDRTVRVNGAQFRIAGVMADEFRGLVPIVAPDYWAPLSLVGQFRPGEQGREGSAGLNIVGRLKAGLSREQALAHLRVWDTQRAAPYAAERQPTGLLLEPKQGTVPLTTDVLLTFTPLFFAFGLILVIACANVANLLLARSIARQREIGIRFAIGASRSRVICQLLTESLLLAFVSSALAFGISRLVLVIVVRAVTSTFPPDIGNIRLAVPPADWRVAMFVVLGAIVSTLFFALAPAFQATRLELVRAIRGEVTREGRSGRARDSLVAMEVTASVLLLICAAIFLRSSWAAARVDPGLRTADILNVRILDEQKRGAVLEAVRTEPLTVSVAASWPGWLGALGARPALAEGAAGKSAVTYQFVSPEYFGILDIGVVRGRNFTAAERSARNAVAIVSESASRQLWPGADAVGQLLRIEPDTNSGAGKPGDPPMVSRTVAIIGVARDVAGFRLGGIRMGGAGVYMPISAEAANTSLTLLVRGDAERARHALVDRLAAIDPNMSEVSTMQTIARAESYILAIPFWLTLVLGALALLMTLSGLFSVLSYLVAQRTKEIGVRMALGATRGRIARVVLSQSARPVGIGLLVGCSLTVALGAALRATPAAQLIGSSVHLFDPIAYAGALISIVIACGCATLVPALRAVGINPVAALRQSL